MTSVHPDIAALNTVRMRVMQLRMEMDELIASITDKVTAQQDYSTSELCDLGWQFREINKAMDEVRKEAKSRQELIGKVLALTMTQEALSDPEKLGDGLTVRGLFATGTPEVRQQAAIPKQGTPAYESLCRHFGVDSEEVIGLGVVQFHFGRLASYVTRLVEEGIPLPSGVTKTYPVYSTTFRTIKGANNGSKEN